MLRKSSSPPGVFEIPVVLWGLLDLGGARKIVTCSVGDSTFKLLIDAVRDTAAILLEAVEGPTSSTLSLLVTGLDGVTGWLRFLYFFVSLVNCYIN